MRRVVLVVDGDVWVHRALSTALAKDDAIEVVPCTTGHGGLNACLALEPHLVVTELALQDADGLWLVAQIREQPSRLSKIPIVMMSACDDEETRLRALRSGVDVFWGKPFAMPALAAQVRALLAMVARLSARDARRTKAAPSDRALAGDLDRMPVASVLAALELDRRTGELSLTGGEDGKRRLLLEVEGGALVRGRVGGLVLPPRAAAREAMSWRGKRFAFLPKEARPRPEDAEPIGALVLAALREMGPPSLRPAPPLPARVPARSGTMPRVPPPAPLGFRLVESLAPPAMTEDDASTSSDVEPDQGTGSRGR